MLSADDRLAITDLVHRYAASVDGGDIPAAAGMFADDGELVIPRPPEFFTPVEAFVGREAIAEALSRVLRLDGTVHEVVGHIIDPVDHDRALGRTACVAHHFIRGKDHEWHIHYDDTYVRTPSGWRIARRAYTVDSMRVSELVYPRVERENRQEDR